ncbi:MAG: peptidase M10, partial [Chitinophagaceae bacterium]
MGTVETGSQQIFINSHIITYGNAANEALTEMIRDEIETMWNEPQARVVFNDYDCRIVFSITAAFEPGIRDIDIYQNLDPRNNYFRIEEFAYGNISFVDGLGCNSGYFKLENLYKGSTTAAHEYGHTIGLNHPDELDIRGKGVPGIMYPRGTLV